MDASDDWLISSLDKYEQLFMYELSTPVKLIKWKSTFNEVWCYGENSRNKRELSILALPGKLAHTISDEMKNDDEDGHLSSGRDFKITAGAIIPFELSCLQEVSNNCVILGNAKHRSIHWWTQHDDLLVEDSMHMIPSPPHLTVAGIDMMGLWSGCQDQLVLGSHSPGLIQLYDSTSQKVVREYYVPGVKIHGIGCHGNQYQLITCRGSTGSISVIDMRAVRDSTTPDTTINSSDNSTFSLSITSLMIGTLSSNTGDILIYDIRSLSAPLYTTNIITTGSSQIINHPQLTISPHEDGMMGVSGVGEGIHIYNMNTNIPYLIHDGHEREEMEQQVLTHTWHPSIHKLLLSTGNNGSLHAWQYV